MKVFVAFVILFTPAFVFSQISGQADYKIKLAEDHFYFDGTLSFNHQESIFSYKRRDESKWIIEDGDFGPMQIVFTDTIGHTVWRSFESKEIAVRSFCGLDEIFTYRDEFTIIWKLVDEQRNISGIECKKALTEFRGRFYEAWYAPSIPVPAGPWKFYGLPGLIVKVSDPKEGVSIYLQELAFPSKALFEKPDTSVNSQIVEFHQCLDEKWDKYYRETQANIARIQAKYPDLEISDNNLPQKRPATEMKFE